MGYRSVKEWSRQLSEVSEHIALVWSLRTDGEQRQFGKGCGWWVHAAGIRRLPRRIYLLDEFEILVVLGTFPDVGKQRKPRAEMLWVSFFLCRCRAGGGAVRGPVFPGLQTAIQTP
jgi:hypothetical protein